MSDLTNKTIKELRDMAQSNAPEAGRDPYVGLTIRFFSIYITYHLIKTKISPNQVTALSVLVFLLGTSLFAFANTDFYFLGILLIYLSIVLDGCDGEIARLKGAKRCVGMTYTEPISHDIQYALFFIPIAIGAYSVHGSVCIVYAAYIATISKLLYRFLNNRFGLMMSRRNKEQGGKKNIYDAKVGKFHKVYRYVNRNFFSSVGTIIPLSLFAIVNRLDLFIYLFAAVYLAVAVIAFSRQVRKIYNFKD